MKNTIVIQDKKTGKDKRVVCRIYDAGDAVVDRYTIAFKGYRVEGYGMVYPYLASSEEPFHPQGFGQHGESKEFLDGKHLGRRVDFADLGSNVQKFILQNV